MSVKLLGVLHLAQNQMRMCSTHVTQKGEYLWDAGRGKKADAFNEDNGVLVMILKSYAYRMFFQVLFPFSHVMCYLSIWFIIVSSIRCLTSVALVIALLMQSWSCSAVRGLPPVYIEIQNVRFVYSWHILMCLYTTQQKFLCSSFRDLNLLRENKGCQRRCTIYFCTFSNPLTKMAKIWLFHCLWVRFLKWHPS